MCVYSKINFKLNLKKLIKRFIYDKLNIIISLNFKNEYFDFFGFG